MRRMNAETNIEVRFYGRAGVVVGPGCRIWIYTEITDTWNTDDADDE